MMKVKISIKNVDEINKMSGRKKLRYKRFLEDIKSIVQYYIDEIDISIPIFKNPKDEE